MAPWYQLGMMALILLAPWGCGASNSLKGQVTEDKWQLMAEVTPTQKRFTKGAHGVITDSVTGLEWYVGPNRDNTWHQAKAWTESLVVAGGGWRLPTILELKGLYQKGASANNMDPIFQANGAWVWSGQLHDASSAWGFAFYSGQEGWHGLDYAYGRLALAVRSKK
jgi:hypothetical protein